MKKKFWLANDECIEAFILDTDSDYFKDYGNVYCETIEEAKEKFAIRINKKIEKIDNEIISLKYLKVELIDKIKNPIIIDDV
jgi:hypothetical protein